MGFIQALDRTFQKYANPEDAKHMKAYMLDQFDFYGIRAAQRRSLMKSVAADHHIEIRDTIRTLVFDLYDQPKREMHMVAMELFDKHLRRSYKLEDIALIEQLITTNSWWDSVDFIAKNILGKYLLAFPDETHKVIEKFSNSDDMWLQRSTIIFQLGYKEKTNKELLFQQCKIHKVSNEFFIKKAIGWALREYGKVNPDAVLKFVETADLKPLSKREAIRRLI